MVDPFASQNPANSQQSNTTTKPIAPKDDAFGGAADVFSDMTSSPAFQPLDPETGKVIEHTPDTLDPFLRDTGSDSMDTSTASLDEEEVTQLHDPFLDDTQNVESQDFGTIQEIDSSEVPFSGDTLPDNEELIPTKPEEIPEQPSGQDIMSEPFSSADTYDTEKDNETSFPAQTVSDPFLDEAPVSEQKEDDLSSPKETSHYDPFLDDSVPENSLTDIQETVSDEVVAPENDDISILSEEAPHIEDVSDTPIITQEPAIHEQDVMSVQDDVVENSVEEDSVPVVEDSVVDTQPIASLDENPPVETDAEEHLSDTPAPSMIQGLVDGMIDPFLSSSTTDSDEQDIQKKPDDEVPLSETPMESNENHDNKNDETSSASSDMATDVVPLVVDEDAIDEDGQAVANEQAQDDNSSEPTVSEVVEDNGPSKLSDLFVKFQELQQALYVVYDTLNNDYADFMLVGSDNDALYTTYSFHTDPSEEQAIVITKETTDRKDNDAKDSHVMRFVINADSLLEVYVDDVLLFTETQLQEEMKSKMQVIDKFNKFIFLVTQFAKDNTKVHDVDTEKAIDEFGDF